MNGSNRTLIIGFILAGNALLGACTPGPTGHPINDNDYSSESSSTRPDRSNAPSQAQ